MVVIATKRQALFEKRLLAARKRLLEKTGLLGNPTSEHVIQHDGLVPQQRGNKKKMGQVEAVLLVPSTTFDSGNIKIIVPVNELN